MTLWDRYGYTSSWIDDDDVRALGQMATKFFDTTIVEHRERWEAQHHVDRDFWRQAGKLGLLCCSIPERFGGGGGSISHDLMVIQTQANCLDLGWGNLVHSLIVAHYILDYGTDEQRLRWLPRLASGDLVGAIAMTEPGAGSDLRGIQTRAVHGPDGGYRLTGSKTFITNGSLAELIIVAAKTDPAAGGRGISLIVVETEGSDGFRRGRNLNKVGQHTGDTCELFFDQMPVPRANCLGDIEGVGFSQMKGQLVQERLAVAVSAAALSERAVEETVAYTRQRTAFGTSLSSMQNTRFELAECACLAHVGRVFLDSCVDRHLNGQLDDATAAMAKYWLTDIQCQIIDRCVQLHGGYGYTTDYPIARMYADARPQRIYAGANEVMKELIARSLEL